LSLTPRLTKRGRFAKVSMSVCWSRTNDRCLVVLVRERKVRAPQDKALGNAQSRQREGKCHRKETAPTAG